MYGQKMTSDSVLAAVCGVASQAGQVILEIYDQDYEVNEKADGSPVTAADHRAHDLISEQLAPLLPGTPVLSEESSEITYQPRADWSRFELLWIVVTRGWVIPIPSVTLEHPRFVG